MSYPNTFIDFLRTYGPIAASGSMYHELVKKAVDNFGVKPLSIPAPRLGDIHTALFGLGVSVVLTGTAGDGKTYHIYKTISDLGFPDSTFQPGQGIAVVTLEGGRSLKIIPDLTGLTKHEKASVIHELASALLSNDGPLFLIAANDGQLLKFWRESLQAGVPEAERIHAALASMLRNDRSEYEGLHARMFNLSHCWGGELVDQVIQEVLRHPGWEGCQDCPSAQGDLPTCPILINRDILLGGGGTPVFRRRLKDTFRLAAANDQHIPIRQAIMLVVNILMGDRAKPEQPILNCERARERAQANSYALTNPYDNALGLNLNAAMREANAVFTIMDTLGIGQETNNYVDTLLLDGQPENLHQAVYVNDQTYGARLFKKYLAQYSKGSIENRAVQAFLDAIQSQRRRLFFTFDEYSGVDGALSPWALTIFKNGAEYVRLMDVQATSSQQETAFRDAMLKLLIKGLNRALTGLMTDESDGIWLAEAIGRADAPVGRVALVGRIPRVPGEAAIWNVALGRDQVTLRPRLELASHVAGHLGLIGVDPAPTLDLRPVVFEYLVRVAGGSLPSSFSRECHEEVRHFALLLRTWIQRKAGAPASGSPSVVKLLSASATGRIEGTDIEIVRA